MQTRGGIILERTGFSAAEVAAVLAAIGLLLSLAAPMFAAGDRQGGRGVAEVISGMTGARRMAMLRQHDVVVTFSVADRALEVHYDEDSDGIRSTDEDVRLLQLPAGVGFDLGPAEAMAGDDAPVTFGSDGTGPRLTFLRDGSVSESGRVYMSPIGDSAPEAGAVRAIAVERSKGMLQCFSFQARAWTASC